MVSSSKYEILPLVDFLLLNLTQQNFNTIENALSIIILLVENGHDFKDKGEKFLHKFSEILRKT